MKKQLGYLLLSLPFLSVICVVWPMLASVPAVAWMALLWVLAAVAAIEVGIRLITK